MSKYDIRKNKPMPSDDEINKYKNFDKVLKQSALYDYKKVTKPLYKNVKFLGIVAALVAVGLIFLFEGDEEKGIYIQKEQGDSTQTDTSKARTTTSSVSHASTDVIQSTHTHSDTPSVALRPNATGVSIEHPVAIYEQHVETDAMSTYSSSSFPGGEIALSSFLDKNIKYPYNAVETPYSGNIEVNMTLEPSGEITHVRILHSPNVAISNEINRVIKLMPKWIPAKENNNPIGSKVTVFFPFIYQGE